MWVSVPLWHNPSKYKPNWSRYYYSETLCNKRSIVTICYVFTGVSIFMENVYTPYMTTRKSHWLLCEELSVGYLPYSASVSRGSYHPKAFFVHTTKTGCPSSPWPPRTAPWGIPDWRSFGTQSNVVPCATSDTRYCNIKTHKIANSFLLTPIICKSTRESRARVSQRYQFLPKKSEVSLEFTVWLVSKPYNFVFKEIIFIEKMDKIV